MAHVIENAIQRRRRSQSQLSFQSDTEHDVLADRIIDESPHNSRFRNRRDRIFSELSGIVVTMHRSTKTALIAIAILICVVVVIVLLNLESIKTGLTSSCIKIDGEETCSSTYDHPYRFFGTKTSYHIGRGNEESKTLDVEGCKPKVFYLFSRHATRYPDEDYIKEMIKLLPSIKDKIINNSLAGDVKICKEDLQKLQDWIETLKPEYDNKISATGVKETIELAKHFKAQFPTLLDKKYSPDKFVFEYTSRERTRSTAEAFAEGLFDENFKKINFENMTNDKVLQFHKDCKSLRKKCEDPSYDISQIQEFENGPLFEQVIASVSERIGVPLTYDSIKTILRACVFGYALDTGDAWCSLFTSDELKVLEFGDDIDDYYKDSYGNKVNYEQACPVVDYIIELFESLRNTSESKAVLQFSHAGGIKKVFSRFGLFRDNEPLTADNFCGQQTRKWRSSMIAPFLANLALVLYDCDNESKIAVFHNEKAVLIDGCTDILCSYDDFYKKYSPIAEKCDIDSICCTCCLP